MSATAAATKAAVLADVAAGMSPRLAAAKHGVGESTAYRWIRGGINWRAAEYAYVGGWELRGGVRYPLLPEQRSA